MLIAFCVECRLEQHCAHVPPGVYLPVQRVKGCPFLAPGLGRGVTLGVSCRVLRSRELCQGACPYVFFGDTGPLAHTAVVVFMRSSPCPGHSFFAPHLCCCARDQRAANHPTRAVTPQLWRGPASPAERLWGCPMLRCSQTQVMQRA